MSTDRHLLEAFASRTKADAGLRRFDLVTARLRYGGSDDDSEGADERIRTRRAYLCVGRCALWLLRCDLSGIIRGGELKYEWIEQVVEDTDSRTRILILLGPGRPTGSPAEVLVVMEQRSSFLEQLSVAFLADTMLRLNRIVSFPKESRALEPEEAAMEPGAHGEESACVLPFRGHRRAALRDYSFFVRREFELTSSPSANVLAFTAPASILSGAHRGELGAIAADGAVSLEVHVYEPALASDLLGIAREHIRWVAMEYKQALMKCPRGRVLRNQAYLKRMNLSNDVAAWVCWEMQLEDPQHTTALVLLRRQYVPPLMDTVQDFAVVARCATRLFGPGARCSAEDLLHEARLVADTFGTEVANPAPYPGLVQAKLDTLSYDEEAYGWMKSRLRLEPDGECDLLKYGWIFVKGIIQILRSEGACPHPELWEDASRRVAALCEQASDQDLDPLAAADKVMRHSSLNMRGQVVEEWAPRVARYLSHCADGGLLGSRLTLADVVGCALSDTCSQEGSRKLEELFTFLLHARLPATLASSSTAAASAPPPRDGGGAKGGRLRPSLLSLDLLAPPTAPFDGATASSSSSAPPGGAAAEVMFTDRVMQLLIESGYLRKVLADHHVQDGSIGAEYANLLCHLLRSRTASVNLKAAVCRRLVAEQPAAERAVALCPGLLQVVREGGVFLATYACAALVNLSQVKACLMGAGVVDACLRQLRANDDDLTMYVLMLLASLAKLPHHRAALKEAGLVPILDDLLSATYGALQHKARVLSEVCGVLGQMCSDEETRNVVRQSPQVLDCLLAVFATIEGLRPGWSEARRPFAPAGSTWAPLRPAAAKLAAKVVFALRQVCAGSPESQDLVGRHTIVHLVADLQHPENLEHRDWASNAIALLHLLAANRGNAELLAKAGWPQAHKVMCASHWGAHEAPAERLRQLDQRISGHLVRR